MIQVPNRFPTVSAPYRIAIVGEAPGRDEELHGRPFIGPSGRFLSKLCSKASLMVEACFVGNICQYRPAGNEIASFDWDGDEIQDGLKQLSLDLNEYKPNLVLCLGAAALHGFMAPQLVPKRRKVKTGLKFAFPHSIDSWRGSLFNAVADSPLPGVKCLAAHHPAFCLRAYENTPLLMFDLRKAHREGQFPELRLPQRRLDIDAKEDIILTRIEAIRASRCSIALDIEGYLHAMSCISIATSPAEAFIIPFFRLDGSSYWTEDEEVRITKALADLLADPLVPKTFQNGLYDRFVLQYGFSMPVLGNQDDTMLKWWEKYCELEKSLAAQASILTDEPYYKSERKSTDTSVHYTYCCRDSAVTFEINEKLDALLTGPSLAHYRLNMVLLNALLYIELRGIRYDPVLAKKRSLEVDSHIYRLQAELDRLAGFGVHGKTNLLALVSSTMCHKKDPLRPKKDFEPVYDRAIALSRQPSLSLEDEGFLNVALGLSLNIKSPAFKTYLYETLGLPEQINRATGSSTTDYGALIKLQKKSDHPSIALAIQIGSLRTRSQMLQIGADTDGRIRCGYNIVGTVSGRITCYTSPTGSGYNLQTIPDRDSLKPKEHPLHNGMRDLILADPGHWLFQCDLKGSDGWTIGAHLNRLGDSTMLDDLRFGIKPASRICYMLRHGIGSLKGLDRAEVKNLLKEVKKEDWDYFACKIGIWGICYLMGPDLLADQILEESEGKIALSRKEVGEFHRAVFEGYKVKLWHDWMARQLAKKPELTSASGNTRRFFGRPEEILGEALSTEPQNNTTYATNLAVYNLWKDPENRVSDKLVCDSKGSLVRVPFRIEPLHQVHDALLGQFKKEDTSWATGKIKQYFNNTLIIAGQPIVIPYEGNCGPSWGEQTYPL